MSQNLFFVSEAGGVWVVFIVFFGVRGAELKHLQREIKDLQHFKGGAKSLIPIFVAAQEKRKKLLKT